MRRFIIVVVFLAVFAGLLPGRMAAASWRVGLQAGHWRSDELPEELKVLRRSTGAAAGGYTEAQVNLDIAQRTAALLRASGVVVDILPATVPVAYQADAFVSLHADGSNDTRASGYKAATNRREWAASVELLEAVRQTYGQAAGLRWDGTRITSGMRGYYGLSPDRYDHAIANTTPGIILEMGFLTSTGDRALMTRQADRLARGIADGILRFLRGEPAGGWPAPPPLPEYRAYVTVPVANLRAAPSLSAEIVGTASQGRRILVDEIAGSWLKIYSSRSRSPRWIHRDLVELSRIRETP